MIAAITQRVVRDPNYGEVRDSLSHDWYGFLQAAGFDTVIPIPNAGSEVSSILKVVRPDCLIFSGGNDVELNQRNCHESDPLNVIRDETESALLREAMHGEIPVLGVCRGMQFFHAFYGGQLTRRAGHAGTYHEIQMIEPFWQEVTHTRTVDVNSFHHFCIESPVPAPLKPLAIAMDGTIEALVHMDYPMVGIMWHPERQQSYDRQDINLLRSLTQRKKG